jgi:hypothetical protein
MKTRLFLITIVSFLFTEGFSQNRINNWDIEKITLIRIESKSKGDKIEVIKFDASGDMDTVLAYFKKIEFKTIDNYNFDKNKVLRQWQYRITFQEYHDQVILCKHYATIGKSIFSIDNKVVKDFKTIITNLKKNNK